MTPEERRKSAMKLVDSIVRRLETCMEHLEDGQNVVAQIAFLENIGDNLRQEASRLLRGR